MLTTRRGGVNQWRDKEGNLAVQIGDRVAWDTLSGLHHEGVIEDIDSNVLVVRCDDGYRRSVEA